MRSLKADGRWRDNRDGTYTAYTATTSGHRSEGDGIEAGRVGHGGTVGAYAITAAATDGAKSAISTDATACLCVRF